MKINIRNRLDSFAHAFRGIYEITRSEPNFIIQVTIAVLVVCAGLIFRITDTEWLVIILFIGLVLSAEAFNSAIEKLCDAIDERPSPRIRFIKDASAAAVLILSIAAASAGILIFWKYIAALFTPDQLPNP